MYRKMGKLAGAVCVMLMTTAGCAQTAGSSAPSTPNKVATPVATPAGPKAEEIRPNFAGVWQLASPERAVLPEFNGELTPEAKANHEHFLKYYNGEDADPAIKVCLNKGMPWTALIRARDYPMEIYQTEDRLFLMFELYDQYRTIRINGDPKPDNYPDGPNGYSVAHWEGDTLVIETTGLSPLNPIGPNLRGSEAKVTERWQLKQDPEYGEVLVVDLIQDDPEIYVKPAHGHNELRRAPAGTVVGGYGCAASLWDAHVERMEEKIAREQEQPVKK